MSTHAVVRSTITVTAPSLGVGWIARGPQWNV